MSDDDHADAAANIMKSALGLARPSSDLALPDVTSK
jgi:hypothetical protein